MAIQFVKFSNRGTIFLPKNHHTQRKLLNFENWVNRKGSKSAKIRLSKSNFYVKNHRNLSDFFCIVEYEFRSTFFVIDIFFITLIFKSLYFLKWYPIFDTSTLTQFSKFNNFLWVCWFLGKNLSNFVPPVWKLHNPYCHITHEGLYRDLHELCYVVKYLMLDWNNNKKSS